MALTSRAGELLRTSGRDEGLLVWVVVGAALLALAASACLSTDPMMGTVLKSSDPAPSFELRDQFNRPVTLADHRGDVVLLTFLYTYCPDICPIVTSHLREIDRKLGDDASQVALVAVSVDPRRDTVERAHAYSEEWGMLDRWAFLVGDDEELAPIWKAYYLSPSIDDHAGSDGGEITEQVESAQRGSVGGLHNETANKYTVTHSAPVYLIDRQGLMRVLFTLPFDPDAVVHDIRLLLK